MTLPIHLNYPPVETGITTHLDTHKRLVLQMVGWLTDSLSGLARHELAIYIAFSTGLKK